MAFTNWFLSEATVHLGQYERAHALGQMCLTLFGEFGEWWGIGVSHFVLGLVALAEEAYAEARQVLQESVAVLREIGHRECTSWALAVLGYVSRGLCQLSEAQQHLSTALRTAAETGAFLPFVLALPAVALLLADRGEVERAVELYALASRYPLVANSQWFEDVAGRHIVSAAAALPREAVTAAQERGRARDREATAKELLAELEGW
jgi:tetratricopeptide (TPR) repeat protein